MKVIHTIILMEIHLKDSGWLDDSVPKSMLP